MTFKLTIPGEPKGKGRPRFTRQGHAYTPDSTAAYEDSVRLAFRQAYPAAEPIGKGIPLTARITAFFLIPKSATKARAAYMEHGFELPTKKPDCDNIAKIVLDALNGIAYHDDAQIAALTVIKSYSRDPRVVVEITETDK